MASENSPANSARIRLRGEVCALYRARAVDPEKKYRLSPWSAALALQGLCACIGQMIAIVFERATTRTTCGVEQTQGLSFE